jgi:hypothetical protein
MVVVLLSILYVFNFLKAFSNASIIFFMFYVIEIYFFKIKNIYFYIVFLIITTLRNIFSPLIYSINSMYMSFSTIIILNKKIILINRVNEHNWVNRQVW